MRVVLWDTRKLDVAKDFAGGYGVGLRLLVPFVNVIRFDVATGEPGRSARFHFAILQKTVMQRRRVR